MGRQQTIPRIRKKMVYEDVREVALVVRRRGKFLVRQCGPKERWAGLWDFPRFAVGDLQANVDLRELAKRCATLTGILPRIGEPLATLRHGVTRFRITLDCYAAIDAGRAECRESARWVSLVELAALPLSVSGRRIASMLRDGKK